MSVVKRAVCMFYFLKPAGSRGDTGKHVDRSSISSAEVIKTVSKWDRLTVTVATGLQRRANRRSPDRSSRVCVSAQLHVFMCEALRLWVYIWVYSALCCAERLGGGGGPRESHGAPVYCLRPHTAESWVDFTLLCFYKVESHKKEEITLCSQLDMNICNPH